MTARASEQRNISSRITNGYHLMHWGRVIAGFTAMGAAAWTAASDWSDQVQYEPAIFLLGSIAAWLGLEFRDRKAPKPTALSSEPKQLSPNDIRLGRRLRAAFPEDIRRFLREHEFGQVFHENKKKPLEDLYYEWKGSGFEFDDAELERDAKDAVCQNSRLLDKLAEYAGPANRYPAGNFSIPTDRERSHDTFEEHTQQRVAEINALAAELLKSFEKFERLYRKKAPEEFA